MPAFRISSHAEQLAAQHLSPDSVRAMFPLLDSAEQSGMIRQWFTEGIPFRFVNKPMQYEALRSFLSSRLSIDAKHLTLIGSSRTGFRIEKGPGFGLALRIDSDLDWTAVSDSLFGDLEADFTRWAEAYGAGSVLPRNSTEAYYWQSNIDDVIPRNIRCGFIDTHLIPNRYPTAKRVNQALHIMRDRLCRSDCRIAPRKASLRVYRSWATFIDRLKNNLKWVLQS